MESKYSHDCDNPYRMLAVTITIRCTPTEVKRIMTDSNYIKQLIQSEVRDGIDISGKFCDCITTELIADRNKVIYRTALNTLGTFFFEQLDIPRLRSEIKKFHDEMGLTIEK